MAFGLRSIRGRVLSKEPCVASIAPWSHVVPGSTAQTKKRIKGRKSDSDPKNTKNQEVSKLAGDPDQLLRRICEAIFSSMRLAGGMPMKNGSVKLVPITDGFVRLGITPAQI